MFGALVVGGGVHGLASAWQLARAPAAGGSGVERVALVERFRLHHDRGSSHGFGRITRSTYSDERTAWVRRNLESQGTSADRALRRVQELRRDDLVRERRRSGH